MFVVVMPSFTSCQEHGRSWVITASRGLAVLHGDLRDTACFTKYVDCQFKTARNTNNSRFRAIGQVSRHPQLRRERKGRVFI